MASVAVLPVLIGLAVDYAIQFQARFNEGRAEGMAPARAATAAAAAGGPVIGAACLATAAGFAALALSPIPMVRSFGLLLVAGIALAFAVAATAGFAALALASWRGEPAAPRDWGPKSAELGRRRRRAGRRLREAGKRALARRDRAARARARGGAGAGGARLGGELAHRGGLGHPRAGAREPAGAAGRERAPGRDRRLGRGQRRRPLRRPRRSRADRLDQRLPAAGCWPTPATRASARAASRRGCAPRSRSPTSSPGAATVRERGSRRRRCWPRSRPTSRRPSSPATRETGDIGDTANIAFGIRVQPLDEQQELIDGIRDQIEADGGPPPGTEVELAGLPVIAAEANADLSRSRYWLPLAGLAAVALVLLAIYRSPRRALVPLVPIVLATGWSALVVAVINVPLNPMSATLGALVIAIATEFSVILAARFERERRRGLSVGEALRRTYALTGTAVLASGVTAIAGFAALAATDIRMLRDFGLVTVADLSVALDRGDAGAAGDARLGRSALRRGAPGAGRRKQPAAPSRGDERGARPAQGAARAGAPPRRDLLGDRRPRLHRDHRRRGDQRAPDRGERRARRERGRGRAAAGPVRGPRPAQRARGRRQHRPGRLRGLARALSRGRAPDAGLRGRGRGRDPRLRPLRPAAGALVLVHARAASARPSRTCSSRSIGATGSRSTSSPSTSATRARRWRASPTSAAGRTRSASTATAPSPTSTGSAAAPPFSTPIPAASSSDTSIGELNERELQAKVAELIAASKERAATVR